MAPPRDYLRRFGYMTPRLVYALAMQRELAVSLPMPNPLPPRSPAAAPAPPAPPRPGRSG